MKKVSFDEITFYNRWKQHPYSRNCDWTIIGISTWWVDPTRYCYKVCFFGLELKIWFIKP